MDFPELDSQLQTRKRIVNVPAVNRNLPPATDGQIALRETNIPFCLRGVIAVKRGGFSCVDYL